MRTGRALVFWDLCRRRGYTADEVRPCIVGEDGDTITVDETHPAYPRLARTGPGTELKALLKIFGIVAKPNCSCNAKARTMDKNGPDWCEANIDAISGWLREEAGKRRLPYLDIAGRALIRMAIRRARKAASKMPRSPLGQT